MAINRIEIAIDCDLPMDEGVTALALMTQSVGLDVERDVEVILTPGDDGRPILLAVLGHDDSDDEDDEGDHDDNA